jgi:hypothetical protein
MPRPLEHERRRLVSARNLSISRFLKLEPPLAIHGGGPGDFVLAAKRRRNAELDSERSSQNVGASRFQIVPKVSPQPILVKLAGRLYDQRGLPRDDSHIGPEPELNAVVADSFSKCGKHRRNDFLIVHGRVLTGCLGARRRPHLTFVVRVAPVPRSMLPVSARPKS